MKHILTASVTERAEMNSAPDRMVGKTIARLRVCADAQQGCRRYMEDYVDLRYEKDKQGRTIAFFAVFDGHGGKDAAVFARNRLWNNLKRRASFHSTEPEKVHKAMCEAFMETHEAMWPHREKWPMTDSGYVSTSGCTASVVVIKGSDIFIAHVGDSTVVLAEKNPDENASSEDSLIAKMLTRDHQPQYASERSRIKAAGGSVEIKKGVTRVVWRRPSFPGQVSTRSSVSRFTNVPFLSVSRALGDLWSWNEEKREYVVSPVPDVMHFKLDLDKHKFLVIASDGVWNVFPAKTTVKKVARIDEEKCSNVAERLVTDVLARCTLANVRSDNTSAIVVFFEKLQDESSDVSDGSIGEKMESDASNDENEPLIEDEAVTNAIISGKPSAPAPTLGEQTNRSSIETHSPTFIAVKPGQKRSENFISQDESCPAAKFIKLDDQSSDKAISDEPNAQGENGSLSSENAKEPVKEISEKSPENIHEDSKAKGIEASDDKCDMGNCTTDGNMTMKKECNDSEECNTPKVPSNPSDPQTETNDLPDETGDSKSINIPSEVKNDEIEKPSADSQHEMQSVNKDDSEMSKVEDEVPENSDPINFDLQTASVTGCNIQTTLLLDITTSTDC